MDVCGRRLAKSKAGDVPTRLRHRQSDARWRANVASCFETLKNIIPVNKRASRRQISKAYVLQETSKHITFLEGVLRMLIEEKANLNQTSEDSGASGAHTTEELRRVNQEFITTQRNRFAALNNERKSKRNKYKVYISDNLPYETDLRAAESVVNKKEIKPLCTSTRHKSVQSELTKSRKVTPQVTKGGKCKNPGKNPKGKQLKGSPRSSQGRKGGRDRTVTTIPLSVESLIPMIIHPPKRIKVDPQVGVENCQIDNVPHPKAPSTRSTAYLNQAQPLDQILANTVTTTAPTRTSSRRKQQAPSKRSALNGSENIAKKIKTRHTMTAINPVVSVAMDRCIGSVPKDQLPVPFMDSAGGISPQCTTAPSLLVGEPGVIATSDTKSYEQKSSCQVEIIHDNRDKENCDVVPEPVDVAIMPVKSPSADPYSMSNHGSCDQLLPLLILSPLKVVTTPTAPTKHSVNCTPVKTPQRPIPASANPYSTPKHESPGQLLPLLILSPLSITSAHTPPTGRSIYCTPLKTLQDDEARTESVFTPVTLPKDWMQTVSAQSPQTYNMSTPTLWNEQKRLDCEEYISSEDEELSKLSHNQAQSLHHRPGKLHWDHLQHLMDSDAGEKRKKGASNRRENMKCRRSLNMSLEFKENNNTTDSSGFGTTEACIEDFDRYYQQLKDSKSEDYREESGVSVDEMYGLVVDTATMHLRAYTDTTLSPLHTTLDDYKRPQHIVEDQMFDDSFTDFLCEPIDWHSTDEYSPLTACKISASVSPDNDVSQIVPKVTNQSMWTDNLDTQLVPSQLENINLNIKTEPTEDTDMDQLTPLECQVLSNEPESKKGESFSTADVLKFIRHQLVSEGVDVIGMMDREDEGLHCEPSESSHVDFGPFLAQMDNGEPEGFDDDLVTQKELLSVGDLSLYQVSGDEEDSGFVTQDCISPLPTLSWT